jgi:hypothetical protein
MNMKKWIFAPLLTLLLLSVPLLGHAQQTVRFSSMKVALWPEYDHPDMLVIYTFTLSQDTQLPANITLRIPAAAGEPNAVAVGPVFGQVGDTSYNRQVLGEWAEITFAATMPAVQFEYYDPGLLKQGAARQYRYSWAGTYAVDSMTIEVQTPMNATDMRLTPNLGAGVMGNEGLVYFISQIGSLNEGQSFQLTVEYQKESDVLSAQRLPVQPSQPLSDSTSGRLSLGGPIPWLIGLVGIALIIGGGVWYFHSGQREPAGQQKKRSRGQRREAQPETSGADVYCSQCGKRAASSDRFCRSCGTKLNIR